MLTVSEIISAALRVDGVAPLSESYLRRLDQAVLLDDAGVLAGVMITDDDQVAEIVVHPDYRNRGIAQRALAGVSGVWAHGDLPAAQHVAAKLGLVKTRELVVMSITEPALSAAADVSIPEGMRIEHLSGPDKELDEKLLKVNNEAFSWHPEQGGWDMQRLEQARDTDWFRFEDVIVVFEDEDLIGFHWTKRHGDLRAGAKGEVYVVGLADSARGRGLGGVLVSAGLAHLVEQGAREVILYVEKDNQPAVKRYRDMGFEVVERHAVYSRL
ncbi:mycothiol synthase [Corynebacterium felinum]|uniref:Mycothiol acetyltransferase n=1 Tax=Corynebacterium felinum TaxID=131318 RepID=A0ABU2B622_9CORY|nr:mycothiol synthase [Corynebacterium felinum]MDF5821681.1 mycothiol synthase [Corynebacterium felinum]MDR7353726.1 mycothiol synthase [Corynebacterium felinum]